MPGITSQRIAVKPNGPLKAKPGSMLARVVERVEPGRVPIHMLLYGTNRVGKTTFMAQFKGKRALIIGCAPPHRNALQSIRNVSGIEFFRMGKEFHRSSEIVALGEELRSSCPYDMVGVDDLTSLDETLLAEICGWDEPALMLAVGHSRPGAKVTGDQYTERSEQMRKVLRPFMDLPCDVILTANEKDHNPNKDDKQQGRGSAAAAAYRRHMESFYAAAMGGGSVKWAQDCCNWICQLYLDKEYKETRSWIGVGKEKQEVVSVEETGRRIRKLRLKLDVNYSAGCNLEYVEGAEVPDFVTGDTPQQMYNAFMKVVNMRAK